MKRKKKNIKHFNSEGFQLEPETKKGVMIIILVALIILAFLSLFNLAGRFGLFLREEIMRKLFGIGYFIFPFLLTAITYLVVVGRKKTFKIIHYIGITFFILSFYGFLHLTEPIETSFKAASEGLGGGYVGLILSYPAVYALDFWGGFIILIAIFIGSILILFNLSIDSLLAGFNILKPLVSGLLKTAGIIKEKFFQKNEEDAEAYYDDKDEKIFEYKDVSEKSVKDKIADKTEKVNNEDNEQQEIEFTSKSLPKRKIDLPLELLDTGGGKPTSGDIERNKEIIKRTLENFNIEVEMGDISVGPTVTQYTLKPAEGVKLSQIVSLSNDLALALAAHPIRIEAPIPGKSLVGIEVPNKMVAKVCIRDIIDSAEFKKRPSNLMISLGKDVTGRIWFTDLTKNPHLLVAGSTGSGKTICINSIIMSLIYQNSPEDIKFIMVDPKRVELTIYNRTPYLATEVIVDVKKTINALKWAVREMERRFEELARVGNRDIFSYRSSGHKMYSIVIIIDELADLMSSSGPEIEALIVRLAQKSRAVGIYLILATQRPSVNVITGVIKANITSRIAFRVASLVDSRTILDSSGAEKLLGRGDMLFVSAEVSKPKRLQGAFISEQEIKKVTDYLRESYDDADYDEEITERQKSGSGGGDGEFEEDDDLINDAKEIVIRSGKASTSFLQRKMRIGYNRAARIMDILEEQDIVGPSEGPSRAREVLVSRESLGDVSGFSPEKE